jgi:predicted metal-dependent enzyme (double-stranded beta helix superfamily)
MQAVFHDPAFWNALEEQPWTHPVRVDAGEPRTLMLRRQRAIELLPGREALGWRRHDISQNLAPEPSNPLRFDTVEGDLQFPDRSYCPTVDARRGGNVREVEEFIADCREAGRGTDGRDLVRELLIRFLEQPDGVVTALGKDEGGIDVLYAAPELTVLNVIWVPRMTIFPHDHRMWATIGIYAGTEANTLYRRGSSQIQAAGERVLDAGDVFSLGPDAIHSVHNPRECFTGAIHVYGGDFVNAPRSQWDPDSLIERPFNLDDSRRRFAQANEDWRSQLGQDLDEHVI